MSNALLLIVPEDKKKKEEVIPENEKWTDTAIRLASKAAPVLLTRSPFGVLGVGALELYEAFDEWSKNRGTSFSKLTKAEASNLRFPPGHAQEGVLYAQHPAQHEKYYPCASFHRFVFEHKFAELISILTALGATRIRVEHVTGWKRDIAASIQAPIEGADTSLGASSNNGQASSLLFEGEYEGHCNPELPHDIVWYQHEPTWQAIRHEQTLHWEQESSRVLGLGHGAYDGLEPYILANQRQHIRSRRCGDERVHHVRPQLLSRRLGAIGN